jgi:hypothetical protein
VLVVLIWSSGDLLWLSMQPFHKLVFRLYRRLRQHGQRLNVPMHTGDTPHEFREAFIAQLTGLATNKRLRARIERAIEEADQLIELYVRLNYTVDAWGKEQQTLALQLWRHLRWRLWTLRIWQRLMTWWASSSLRPILRQLRSAYEQ